jgi:hypothetical protein
VRRPLVFVGVVLASLCASIGLSAAGSPPTLEATPNPVEVNGDVTITNSPNSASTCQDNSGSLTEGDNVATVNVDIAPEDGPSVFNENATPDDEGNWEDVAQIAEPGTYQVLAVCNGGGTCQAGSAGAARCGSGGGLVAEAAAPFTYQIAELTVVQTDEPVDPVDPPATPPAAQPQDLQPAFTG